MRHCILPTAGGKAIPCIKSVEDGAAIIKEAVDTFGTEKIDPAAFEPLVREHFQLTPKGIIDSLQLRKPIYLLTAAHGHFGRVPGEGGEGTFTWESTDKAEALRSAATASASM